MYFTTHSRMDPTSLPLLPHLTPHNSYLGYQQMRRIVCPHPLSLPLPNQWKRQLHHHSLYWASHYIGEMYSI